MSELSRAVFLSYASQDAEAALRICEALRAAGIDVWFDQSELRGGDAWDQKIRRQIKDCALFIPIISAHTQARTEGYFRLEWHLADQRKLLMTKSRPFLVPLCIDGTPDADAEVPDSFAAVQWTRLPAGEIPPAFAEHVSRLLSPEPAQSSAGIPPSAIAAPNTAMASRQPVPTPVALWTTRALVAMAALAVITLCYFAVDKFVLSKRVVRPLAVSINSAPIAIPEKSIAVLPFLDMSEKHDQEYFSDGLAEELLDLLAQVPGLQVIARTSSFSFKGKSEDLPTIARKLNVANVLEGSVRKSGRRLRITTQLIRADTGVHIWSETYDRDQEDVFKVQEDIARAVVGRLKLALFGGVPFSSARTSNPELYNLLLQGRYFVVFDTPDGTNKALDCYRRAIALDPTYAPAWTGMSYALDRQVANGYIPVEAGFAQAMSAARKAVEIDPTFADAYVMVGRMKMAIDYDWSGAKEAYEHALQLDPNNSHALFSSAHLTMTVGSTDETVVLFQQLLERDPLNLLYRRYVARVLLYAGRFAEAEAMIHQVLDMSPSFPAAHYELGRILLARGQISPAVAEFEAEPIGWRALGLPLGYHAQGRSADANAALAALVLDSAGSEFQVAEAYAFLGDVDKALYWLDQAVLKRDPGIQWLRGDPFLKGVTRDPRYKALLRKLKLPE